MDLKQQIHAQCRALVAGKIAAHQQALKELVASAANETKSTAGDKYETARAMLHIEQDGVRRQLAEALGQQAVLDAIDPEVAHDRAGLGSLVRAGGAYYYISTALGKLQAQGHTVYALSPQSPLGSALMGLQAGGSVTVNGRRITIESVA